MLLPGSLINVSAGGEGDAGSISIYAPGKGALLAGDMEGGAAAGGAPGSFSLVTGAAIGDYTTLNQQLSNGGFAGTINIEATTGDISIPSGETVYAKSFTLSADGGSIFVDGTIHASQAGQGGSVALYAGQDLTINKDAVIDAYGTGTNASGGSVTLAVNTGVLTFANGMIDVSGTGSGAGGTVLFRDPPPLTGGTAMSLSGTIKGASSVVAEVDEVYTCGATCTLNGSSSDLNGTSVSSYLTTQASSGVYTTTINSNSIGDIAADLATFMANNATLATELQTGLTDGSGNSLASIFQFQPGVVIEQTNGNITVANNWNLTSWGYTGTPGMLTLRASKNLNVNANLYDNASLGSASWNIDLVAGANTASANPLAVVPASAGNLSIASTNVVYTASGSIGFASGGDAVIGDPGLNSYASLLPNASGYNLATYSGNIVGNVEGNLTLSGGVIATATGDIDINVGGNLTLGLNSSMSTLGAIVTTGNAVKTATSGGGSYWTSSGGGNIVLNVGGDVDGLVLSSISCWLAEDITSTYVSRGKYTYTYIIYPNFAALQGIETLGDGDIFIREGGNFMGEAGAFGAGNLSVYSGGDLEGRFLVRGDVSNLLTDPSPPSIGTLVAMGNFGMPEQYQNGLLKSWAQLIEMSNAQVSVTAEGNVELGAVVNPDLALAIGITYTQNSAISLTAVTGDVNLYGTMDSRYGSSYGSSASAWSYLPASVAITAGGDINVMAGFTQLPASQEYGYGKLSMIAGGDILFGTSSSAASWTMSDADPTSVYAFAGGSTNFPSLVVSHASSPDYTGDATPVIISADGNIKDMNITLPEAATIFAGGNITDLNFSGQNIQAGDVTSITALGNLVYDHGTNVNDVNDETIDLGGPGYLVVQAGGRIDLGASKGIQVVGNYINQHLATGGSLIVAAGFADALAAPGVSTELSDFFDALRTAGNQYTPLLQTDPAAAQAIIDKTRATVIESFFASHGEKSGGDIDMTYSQIFTSSSGSISLLATGSVNVGTTALGSGNSVTSGIVVTKNFGIMTEAGGAINIFSVGDVNVNESRVMTFDGGDITNGWGDITIWSDQGNINAGKGDREAVSGVTPHWALVGTTYELTFTPPVTGSGIRAVTYSTTPAGDLYVFAPAGVVNAGEAGMSGANVTIGAMNGILNAANISYSGHAIGLPPPSQDVGLGLLSGASSGSELGSKGTISSLSMTGESRVASAQPIEDVVLRWVDVEITDVDWNRGVVGGQ